MNYHDPGDDDDDEYGMEKENELSFEEFIHADTVLPLRESQQRELHMHQLTKEEQEQIRQLLVQSSRLSDALDHLKHAVEIIRGDVIALQEQTSQHAKHIGELQVAVKGVTQQVRRLEKPMRHIQASLAALGAKLDDSV